MSSTEHRESLIASAAESLAVVREKATTRPQLLKTYRAFLKKENQRIQNLHKEGGSGILVAAERSAIVDVVINDLLTTSLEDSGATEKEKHPITLVASGGYGRGLLNPGSDIDLLFLMAGSTRSLPQPVQDTIEQTLMMLFDVGFKVGHAVRSIPEALKFANKDHTTKTALLDARFITGDKKLFENFEDRFFKTCVKGQEKAYLEERSRDIRARHKKGKRTVHLQEPNVKEGCGGLRDYHNLIWVIWVLRRSRDLSALVKEDSLSQLAFEEIEAAYEFLTRVRNGLHYAQKSRSGDILTLRLQGLVCKAFGYKGKSILRKTEAFMKDYYFHTRKLFQHSTSLMQRFEMEIDSDDTGPIPFIGFLAKRKAKTERFDGFVSKGGLIFAETDSVFEEDPKRLIRMFLHTQSRHLTTSPEIRKLFKENWNRIDGNFRKNKANRETFEAILQQRGSVARILRQMHRVGFLGRFLPEFGQLTDLVQHEFFHRYSADEHTLRCIEELDKVLKTEDPKVQLFTKLFQEVEDPVGLYVALIMHDTGRAENFRKHEDGSAMLASQVCTRLNFRGDRRRLITFLVDHHLTFWRTATTRDLSDPDTIAEFANAVQTQQWMEALYLFTFVDSNGTNEEAWNDWKASLMHQLYRSTTAYFQDKEAFEEKFNRPVDKTRAKAIAKLPESYLEEIDAHFETMPKRYFLYRGASSVIRHVKLFHRFLKLVKKDPVASLVPIVGAEARPGEGYSLIEVVGWNRHHLLAKVAGALAARNLNILSADLFTRDDDLVLDIFRVCNTSFKPAPKREIERIEALFQQEFGATDEDVDFHELIGKNRKPNRYADNMLIEIPQRVFASNNLNDECSVLELQAQDRIGLLYDVFTVLGDLNAEVVHARISTQAGAAIDRFLLVDSVQGKKLDDERLSEIELALRIVLEARG